LIKSKSKYQTETVSWLPTATILFFIYLQKTDIKKQFINLKNTFWVLEQFISSKTVEYTNL